MLKFIILHRLKGDSAHHLESELGHSYKKLFRPTTFRPKSHKNLNEIKLSNLHSKPLLH